MDLAQRLAGLSAERRRALEALAKPHPIVRTVAGEAPASFEQERLWFLRQLDPDDASYNLHIQLPLPAAVDPQILTATWRYLLERHESLRTRFIERAGVPAQVIGAAELAPIPVTDLSRLPASERRLAAARIAAEQAETAFDLTRGPLLRLNLLRLPDHWIQLLTIHHIIADGWSIDVLMRDMNVAYSALAQGRTVPLAPLRIQFSDFARWQRAQLTGTALEDLLAFWTRYLDGAPDLLLPTDRSRSAQTTRRAGMVSRILPASLRAGIAELGRREGATVFQVLLAAYATLLHRYTGQLDLVFGMPVANRDVPEVEDLIGFFLNTVLVRVRLSPEQSFRQVLSATRAASVDAYSGQRLPFSRLVQQLNPQRHLDRNPLYQATVQLLRSRDASATTNAVIEEIGYERSTTNVDLALDLLEGAEGLRTRFEYNRDLFDEATVARLLEHWERLLQAVLDNPETPVGVLRLTTAEEAASLIHQGCARTDAPTEGWHFHGFGDRAAIVSARGTLSYAELDRLCGQLASVLKSRGAGPESVVALHLADPVETVVAILASWRVQAAFTYIDPAFPTQRVARILEDVTPVMVLDESPGWRHEMQSAAVLLPDHLPAAALAAVIYTSGSTGIPKGVMIEHGALANQIRWLQSALGLQAGDVILQKYAFTFDASLSELLSALAVGATLVIAGERGRDVDELISLIRTQRVTVLDVFPSLLALLLGHEEFRRCLSLRCVVVGGEHFSTTLAARLAETLPQVEIINAYGPTEATITATARHLRPGEARMGLVDAAHTVPIGQPIAGNSAYVLDAAQQPVPPGIAGELVLGGAGLARGYLKDDELTRQRFIRNPFGPGCLFATGDRARWRADGELEMLGRLDLQVKVRGYRIEIEEIEHVLRQHPAVREAVVALITAPRVPEPEAQLMQWRLQQLSTHEAEFLYRFETDQDAIGSQTMWRTTADFNLYLHLQHPQFMGSLEPRQRKWALQRALDEAVDDLRALESSARRCHEGAPRPPMTTPWNASPAVYSEEELVIEGQQVMQAWERPLMAALAQSTAADGGDIAEIGFGMGIAATYLQEKAIRSHTIVECHPGVLERLEAWRAQRANTRIEIVARRWQEWTPEPDSFDGVLFDTYPTSEEEYFAEVAATTYAASFFPFAHRMLRSGGVFTYYTNEIDSLSRRHQRLLLEYFSSFSVSIVRNLAPPPTCQYWWADSMAVVRAVK